MMTDAYNNVPPSLLWPETYFAVLFNEDRKSLRQWFSKCGPCTASISIMTWELVRNADWQAPAQTC